MSRVLVIGNPAAGRGRARARWRAVAPAVAEQIGGHDLVWTRGPKEAVDIARREAGERELIVAFGGDGTASETARGLSQAAENAAAVAELGLLPSGTGNDFAQAVGTPGRLADAVRFLARSRAQPTDLGRVESADGPALTFLNSCSVGLAAAVNERARAGSGRLGGGSYAAAAARELISSRAGRYRVALDDAPDRPRLLLNVSLLNTRRIGGGIPLAPPANPGDGLLDAVLIGPLGPVAVLDAVARLVQGTHFGHRAIEHRPVRRMRIEPLDPVGPAGMSLEVDGEQAHARGGVTVSVAPGAIRIRRE